MKKTLLLILFPFILSAQDFKILDFPNYNFWRQSLNFSFDSYSSTSSDFFTNGNETNIRWNLLHNLNIQTQQYQLHNSANLSWSHGNDVLDVISINNDLTFRGYNDQQSYYLLSWKHYRSLRKKVDQKPFRNTYNNEITIGLGAGRIDNFSDTYHANNIIKLLKKRGFNIRPFDTLEFKNFVNKISEIKNNRIPDFRFKKIYETEQLLTYLHSVDFFEVTDFVFLSHLLDVWNYERQFVEFGSRFELSYINRWFNNDNYFDNYTIITHKVEFNYTYFTPLFTELIFKLSNSLSGEILTNADTEDEASQNIRFEQLGSLEYLFSSRFSIENSIQTNWYLYNEVNFGRNSFPSIFTYNLSLYWFFSPFSTLNINFQQRLSFNDDDLDFGTNYSVFRITLNRGFY